MNQNAFSGSHIYSSSRPGNSFRVVPLERLGYMEVGKSAAGYRLTYPRINVADTYSAFICLPVLVLPPSILYLQYQKWGCN